MSDTYIEIVGAVMVRRHNLNDSELREIGRFISGNVWMWLDNHKGLDWVGMLPVVDFHAVCGDIDIPWATEEAKQIFSRCYPSAQCASDPASR